MKHSRLTSLLWVSVAALTLLSGCFEFKPVTGNYTGTLEESIATIGAASTSSAGSQVFKVKAKVSEAGSDTWELSVTDSAPAYPSQETLPSWTIEVDGKTVYLKQNGVKKELKLSREKNDKGHWIDGCFISDKTEVCLSNFEIEIRDQSLTGPNATKTRVLKLIRKVEDSGALAKSTAAEVPAYYSPAELFDRALSSSYEARAQYETLAQAKARYRGAYLNLLPHLSASTITNVGGGSLQQGIPISYMDLAPFLMPSRWADAKVSHETYKVEQAGYAIARANAARSAEELAWTVAENAHTLKVLSESRDVVLPLYQEVLLREKLGAFGSGSSDYIQDNLNWLDQAIAFTEQLQVFALANLSQALGFHRPDAILGIQAEVGEDIASALSVYDGLNLPTSLADEAISRSIELGQIDASIKVAHANKFSRPFLWLDPYADATNSLGFSMGEGLKLVRSQVRAIEIAREKAESNLRFRATALQTQIGEDPGLLVLAQKATQIQERRLARLKAALNLGSEISLLDLSNTLDDYARARLGELTAVHGAKQRLRDLERIQWEKRYSGLTIPARSL